MKKRIILVALISFITMSFTAKSQTTFDTKNCQFKIVINKNELFFV
jgi:peptidoglycan hydrolase CwlO-like protein